MYSTKEKHEKRQNEIQQIMSFYENDKEGIYTSLIDVDIFHLLYKLKKIKKDELKIQIKDLEEDIKCIDILLKEGWEKGSKRHKGLLKNQKRFPKLLAEKKAELESLS